MLGRLEIIFVQFVHQFEKRKTPYIRFPLKIGYSILYYTMYKIVCTFQTKTDFALIFSLKILYHTYLLEKKVRWTKRRHEIFDPGDWQFLWYLAPCHNQDYLG